MSYELTNKSGDRMQLLHREWEVLLILAERYGWMPERGNIGHYAQGDVVSGIDAAGMAVALERALPDVPGFYADGLTEAERVRPKTVRELRQRPGDKQGDPVAYFSGRGRDLLMRFARQMASEPFRVRLIPASAPNSSQRLS